MPHIHTNLGEADFVADVYIVHNGKVLLRFHEKHHRWLAVGGHIELNEVPEEAAIREVKEEVGLDVRLVSTHNTEPWSEDQDADSADGQPLRVPEFMDVHPIGDQHRHISLVFFAVSDTDVLAIPDTHEKAECRWLSEGDIESGKVELLPRIRQYALAALQGVKS